MAPNPQDQKSQKPRINLFRRTTTTTTTTQIKKGPRERRRARLNSGNFDTNLGDGDGFISLKNLRSPGTVGTFTVIPYLFAEERKFLYRRKKTSSKSIEKWKLCWVEDCQSLLTAWRKWSENAWLLCLKKNICYIWYQKHVLKRWRLSPISWPAFGKVRAFDCRLGCCGGFDRTTVRGIL